MKTKLTSSSFVCLLEGCWDYILSTSREILLLSCIKFWTFNYPGWPSLLLQQDTQQAEEGREHHDEPDGCGHYQDAQRAVQSNEARGLSTFSFSFLSLFPFPSLLLVSPPSKNHFPRMSAWWRSPPPPRAAPLVGESPRMPAVTWDLWRTQSLSTVPPVPVRRTSTRKQQIMIQRWPHH